MFPKLKSVGFHAFVATGWKLPYNSSIGVAVLWFLWYRSSHPDPKKSPQLQIWPHHRSDTASQVFSFLCWGTEISQMLPNQENMEGDQPVQKPQSCTAVIATTDLCAGALSWGNRTPFLSFPGLSWNVSSTTFQSPELVIQCGFIWKETMQLVSGNVEFNACQVSLLWHNSFYELFRPPLYVCECVTVVLESLVSKETCRLPGRRALVVVFIKNMLFRDNHICSVWMPLKNRILNVTGWKFTIL